MENINRVIKRYWIAGFPYFESTVIFIPNDINEEYESPVNMLIYDQDGEQINNVGLSVNNKTPLLVNLENFMGDCKPESGMKYCTLVCETDDFIDTYVRLQTKKMGSFICELKEVNSKNAMFFPVSFLRNKSSVLVLANACDKENVMVDVRVLVANRAPLETISLNLNGSRMMFLKDVFQDLLSELDDEEKGGGAYIKISISRNNEESKDVKVGAFVFDYFEGDENDGNFISLA